jgi:hypothetical protein
MYETSTKQLVWRGQAGQTPEEYSKGRCEAAAKLPAEEKVSRQAGVFSQKL